jgi:hypothetical protein
MHHGHQRRTTEEAARWRFIYCIYGLQKAGLAQKPGVNIDVAGLMYYCALRYETSFLENDYYPSARAFQDEIVYLKFILKWDVLVVFDGKDPAWKDAEHNRRYGDDVVDDDGVKTKIRNNGTYTLCAKICAGLKIPNVSLDLLPAMTIGRQPRHILSNQGGKALAPSNALEAAPLASNLSRR